ncbi:unnamed protein product [Somion occarium]|uniref:WW domain-containing protein n=1 Tax=Somion occarium TaxID=3059160 RepID=A0ABP1DPC3_9APHY
MEEDTEVLDWGNEDDEQQVQGSHGSHHLQKRSDARDDAEDAVSLGGDDDDLQDFSAYQSRPERDVEKIQPLSSKRVSTPQPQQNSQNKRDLQREHSGSTQISSRQAESPQLGRSQSLSMTKLTHALPPKPVLVVPDVVPSPPHASTLASSMVHRDRRSNGLGRGKSASVEAGDRLPADWEIRHPRGGGREAYYYNVKTHESTWTRPDGTGRVSPTKDRDSVARSPLRGVDDGTRSQGLARVAPRKEPKRQVSPAPNLDGLSYEDRHYRPGDSSNSMNTGDRKEERAPRPQLPRTLDDRRPRSVTSPRRDVHLRRGLSRSPSPVNDTWRGARDEFRSRSPVPDRTRGRPRKEDTRSPSPEIRPSRGRRQRADIEPPLAQDQAIRRGISREWPAHRHRSPPSHPREPSPVNLRRIADSWEPSPTTAAPTTKRKNRNDRSPSPVSKRPISRRDEYTADSYVSDAYVRQTEDAYAPRQVDDSYVPRSTGDVYVPADLIPQRRGRDQDHVIENENEAKRRRVDDRPTESSPSVRRIPLPDRAELATPNSLPQRPSSTQESDQPRRKRQPLPPQSTRFKEASKFPSTPAIPPPAPTLPPAPSRPRESQDARFLNGPINVYADVPSGPRSKTKGLQGDLMPRVPSKAYPAPPIVAPTQQEPRAMDVDYPQPVRSQPPRRPDDSLARSTSSTHLDRQVSDMQSESIPKGPRAMTKMNMPGGYGPPASFPPAPTSKGTPEPSRSPAAMRGRPLQGRPPPPHMAANPDVWPHRRESIPTGPGTPGAAPQRFEDTRDTAPGGPSKRRLSSARESMASKPADVRESSERPLRRIAPTPSAPAMKLSGTNNIPIGTRRTAPVTEQPLAAPLRPAERFRSTPGLPPPDRLEIKTRFPETWVNVSQESSPGYRYRNLLPESERRRVSESSRDAPESHSSTRVPSSPTEC